LPRLWVHQYQIQKAARDLAQVALLMGLAHSGLAQQSEAIQNFRIAHALDPSIGLPPNSSPRVIQWWVVATSKGTVRVWASTACWSALR
jgi:hypothetical protein